MTIDSDEESTSRATELIDMLYRAAQETPSFMNGILLNDFQFEKLIMALEHFHFESNLLAKYEKMTQDSIERDQSLVGEILVGLLHKND